MTKCILCGKLKTEQSFDEQDYGTILENTCLDCQDIIDETNSINAIHEIEGDE